MANRNRRTAVFAVVIAAVLGAVGSGAALAQEYADAIVTVGGGPGTVIISGGEVINQTGIGVDSGGGASIGASTGGDQSEALFQ
jgi:hypothetical protein